MLFPTISISGKVFAKYQFLDRRQAVVLRPWGGGRGDEVEAGCIFPWLGTGISL